MPAGRRKLARAVREEHQRERALSSAVHVFAEKGYLGTTVDDLVAAASMGVGSFYAHFKGKEECLIATYRQLVADVRAAMTAAAERADGWPEHVCVGLRELLRWVAAEPAAAKVVLIEIQTGGPAALDLYEDVLLEVAEFLRRGRGRLEPSSPLPESLEQTTVCGIAWLLHRRLAAEEADPVPALFEELGMLVLEPYLGEDQAREAVAAGSMAQSG